MARLLWLLFLALCCSCALACGPFFPNMMLVGGDEPVFTAPVARFYAELERMEKRLRINKPPFPVVNGTNTAAETTREIDLADLRAALKKRGGAPEAIASLVQAYQDERTKLVSYADALERWRLAQDRWDADTNNPPPELPPLNVPPGLPGEFSDYLRGAMAWHRGDTNAARAEWKKLLARPAAERRFKSTWAAFMLAKSYDGREPARAITHYGLVRALAAEGFSDSLGLAASSIGWQARAHLQNNEIAYAIERYLEQATMETGGAYESLRIAARQALKSSPAVLDSLAKHPQARAVITAHVISMELSWWEMSDEGKRISPALAWLEAMERAEVKDVDSAEQLALANYQAGRFDIAQRWIKRAPDSPVAKWLQAKLHLRSGKVKEAGAILAELTRVFPLSGPTNAPNISLAENLYIPTDGWDKLTIGRQVRGELGVLRLHRREYTQALDALLRAGFYTDAAYVAERVLTLDELRRYVDQNWSEPAFCSSNATEDDQRECTASRTVRRLLAQRLARNDHLLEARSYFQPGGGPLGAYDDVHVVEKLDELIAMLRRAYDTELPKETQARALFSAAWMVRTNGMELLGTSVEPDFSLWRGSFFYGPTVGERETNAAKSVVGATGDEIQRGRTHAPVPDERFHYRYQAAVLALEAAKLLPTNSDELAKVLYDAGCWLKGRDPNIADIFYKLLVRRCRKTELGDAADRQRWFPRLDENGKPIVTRKPKVDVKVLEPAAPPEGEAQTLSTDPTPEQLN